MSQGLTRALMGASGFSGFSGFGTSGWSGTSGVAGSVGTSGASGFSGFPGSLFNLFNNPRMDFAQYGQLMGGTYVLITISGTSGVSGFAQTENILANMAVSGAGVPSATKVASVDAQNHVYLTNNVTATSASAVLTFFQTCATVSGSSSCTGIQSTSGMYAGQQIAECVGFATPNIQISSIVNATSVTLNKLATATATVNFIPGIQENGAQGSGAGFVADCWEGWASSTTSGDTQLYRTTLLPGTGPNTDSKYAMQITSVAGTTAGASNRLFFQRIESARTGAGQTLTLKFAARLLALTAPTTVTTLSVPVLFQQNFGIGGNTAHSSATSTSVGTASVTTSWQVFTYTFNVPSVAGVIFGQNYGTDYCEVDLQLPTSGSGTKFILETTDWFLGPADYGPIFPAVNPAVELVKCQRSLQVINGGSVRIGLGFCSSTTICEVFRPLIVPMRIIPTVAVRILSDYATTPTSSTVTSWTVSSSDTTAGDCANINLRLTAAAAPFTANAIQIISATGSGSPWMQFYASL